MTDKPAPVPQESFAFTIAPHGWRIEAHAAVTLREAAALAGIVLPTSCRNGTCRTCMCRLLAGRVHYDIDWPGLSAEEKAEGWILPCVAYPDADIALEAPQARRAG